LVLPSIDSKHWSEQFGHVLIEAMAESVPVIGSDAGAIAEVIGDAGIVFKQGDHLQLAEAISKLANDSNIADMLINKGRKRVQSFYTNQVIADQTFQIWKETLADCKNILVLKADGLGDLVCASPLIKRNIDHRGENHQSCICPFRKLVPQLCPCNIPQPIPFV